MARLLIIDLHLSEKLVIIVGAGNEALKRIKLLLNEECQIIVLGQKPNPEIEKLHSQKKIILKKIKLSSTKFLKELKPFLVITATTDKSLNKKIIQDAKKMNIMSYASDSPGTSDIAFLSLINIKDIIRVGLSTGGSSPIMAKKLRMKTEQVLKNSISDQDIQLIKLQKFARIESKKYISTQQERKKFLYSIVHDKRVKELLKDGKYKRIQTIIKKMVKEWS